MELAAPAARSSSSVYLPLAALKAIVKIVSGDILLKVICSVVEDELAPEGGRDTIFNKVRWWQS